MLRAFVPLLLAGSVLASPAPAVPSGELHAETLVATGARVEMVADLNPGPSSANVDGQLFAAGGFLYFAATTPGIGQEPWVSGGTAATTRLVGDFTPGPEGSRLRDVTSTAQGTLLGVWVGPRRESYWTTTTTGTASGESTLLWETDELSVDALEFDGDALLAASNFRGRAVLWRTDGLPGAPVELTSDLILGGSLTRAGDRVFFLDASNPLMVTDGTPDGTKVVRGWTDGPYGSATARALHAVRDKVVFEVESRYRVGAELWVSDGTPTGTRLLRDINRGPGDSGPRDMHRFAGLLYFTAEDGIHGREIWRTDGTWAGTTRVTDLPFSPRSMHVCGRLLEYFRANARTSSLWSTDPATGASQRIAKIPSKPGTSPHSLRCLPGGAAFIATDGIHGHELWTLENGSSAALLHDINPGAASSQPGSLKRVGRLLYFVADDGVHGRELWASSFQG